MTTTNGTGELLKTDGCGRVRVPRERQEALVDEFERSGLSGPKFAAMCGLKYPSFIGWVQRRRRERAEGTGKVTGAAGPVRWLEASLGGSGGGGSLVLQWPGGVRLEITHRGQVALAAELLRALCATEGSSHAPRHAEF